MTSTRTLDLTSGDDLLAVLRSVTSVCRTGQWLDGHQATDAERTACRDMLRQANLALLATGQRVEL